MSEVWKSPRQIEKEVTDYKKRRFEYWWGEQDRGAISRNLALTALREEMNYADLRVRNVGEIPSEDPDEGNLF
jgi:hypothetical protein